MEDLTVMEPRSINRRVVMAGWAGLGAAALVGAKLASAQDSTPATDDTTGTSTDTTAADMEAQALAMYEVFLTSVATSLGATDNAAVDLAVRDGLKAIIDQRLADGDISANSATEKKAAIDEAVVPISFLSRRAAAGGSMGRGGRSERPGMSDDDDMDDDTMPADDSTAASTPTT